MGFPGKVISAMCFGALVKCTLYSACLECFVGAS
jgi:hypothetical protein